MNYAKISDALRPEAWGDTRTGTLVETARKGLSYSVARRLADENGLAAWSMDKLTGSSARTMQRKKSADRELSKAELSNLFEVVRVSQDAASTLGSLEKAMRWMESPIMSLGGERPLHLMDTPMGRRRVTQVLGRIRHGIHG